jgi:hypothetical protein
MAKELTAAVPVDDEYVSDDRETGARRMPHETDQDETDEAVDAKDADVAATDDAPPPVDAALADLSAEDLEALVGDDNPRGIPKSRFDEVNNERKAFAEQNALLAKALAEREQRAAPVVAESAKPRDFEAERAAIKSKFDSGDLDVAAYLAEARKIDRAEDRAELDQKLQPVVKSLEDERAQIQNERLTARMEIEAQKLFEKYAFLDHTKTETANTEAITKVVAQRDELIHAGIEPVKALRLAVAAVAPEYEDKAAPRADDLAAVRRLAAQRKAAEASQRQPAALRGTSDRVVDGSEHISGSVKDHDTWEQRQRAQVK